MDTQVDSSSLLPYRASLHGSLQKLPWGMYLGEESCMYFSTHFPQWVLSNFFDYGFTNILNHPFNIQQMTRRQEANYVYNKMYSILVLTPKWIPHGKTQTLRRNEVILILGENAEESRDLFFLFLYYPPSFCPSLCNPFSSKLPHWSFLRDWPIIRLFCLKKIISQLSFAHFSTCRSPTKV